MCQPGTLHDSPEHRLREGLKRDLLGERWGAVALLESLLHDCPAFLEAYGHLAWIHSLQGNLAASKDLLEQLIERQPENVEAANRLRELSEEPDRLAGGATDPETILSIARGPALDSSREARSRQRQALILFRRVWEERGDEESAGWVSRLAFVLQDFPASLEATLQLHRMHPGDFETTLRLGLIHENLGESGEAIAHYRAALDIDPSACGVLANLIALGAESSGPLPEGHPLAPLFGVSSAARSTQGPSIGRRIQHRLARLFTGGNASPAERAEGLAARLGSDPGFEPLPCNLCRGGEFVGVAVGRENGWPIQRCRSCGLVQTHPQPTQATLTRKYQEQYYGDRSLEVARAIHDGPDVGGAPMTMLPRAIDFLLGQGLDEWEASLPGKRMLDVGCGEGILMRDFRIRGWECEGTEVSSPAIRFLSERGYRIHEGTVDSLKLPDAAYSLVTLSHVIEHVRDPLGDLRILHEALAPGGWLFVTTPGADSLTARIAGEDWFYDPDHIFFFSRESLRRMFEAAGFEVFGEASYVGAGRETWEEAWLREGYGPAVRRLVEERNEGDVLLMVGRRE